MEVLVCAVLAYFIVGAWDTQKALTAAPPQRPYWASHASGAAIVLSVLFWPIGRCVNGFGHERMTTMGVVLSTLVSSACQWAAIAGWLWFTLWLAGLMTSGALRFVVAVVIAIPSSFIAVPLLTLLVLVLIQMPIGLVVEAVFRRR